MLSKNFYIVCMDLYKLCYIFPQMFSNLMKLEIHLSRILNNSHIVCWHRFGVVEAVVTTLKVYFEPVEAHSVATFRGVPVLPILGTVGNI